MVISQNGELDTFFMQHLFFTVWVVDHRRERDVCFLLRSFCSFWLWGFFLLFFCFCFSFSHWLLFFGALFVSAILSQHNILSCISLLTLLADLEIVSFKSYSKPHFNMRMKALCRRKRSIKYQNKDAVDLFLIFEEN